MTENPSITESLMHRRVPQFVGMYIAATWLVIELGDWVTERFTLPAELTSYVFVAMLLMLPAVVLFSYTHGAPGKDKSTTGERIAISLNALLAVGVLFFVSPLLNVEAATETVLIPDETGVVQEFEVARQGFHKEVIGFFWRNNSGNGDLDWLSYGLPLMLAHDLNRVSPVITVETPFDSFGMRNELRNKGYPSFLNEPRGLRVEIARDRHSAALIVGEFSEVDGTITVDATLIDAESGDEIGSHSVTGSDWLIAVDDISVAVQNYLKVKPGDNQSDDPIGQHFSSSLEAIRHFTNSQVALDINNDYPLGIAELTSAVELDPEFAEANGDLSITHYLSSDIESARAAATLALNNSYRLSETSKFVLKANRYMFDGDYDRGERVVDIWTQVQPTSTEALGAMGRLNRVRGTDASLQKASDAYDRLLELEPKNYEIFLQKAQVEQQRGDYAAAAGYLRNYLDREPDSGDAHRQLANVHQAMGDLEAAQASLEDAAILSDSPLESEIGLARLEARRGFFDAAETRLSGQLDEALGPQQQVQVLSAQTEVAFVRGQIEKAIALQAEVNEIAKEFMPPMVRLMRVQRQEPTLLILIGKTEEAIALADAIMAQLQPPIDAYMNFTYTAIYDAAGDRQAYRQWVEKTVQDRNQLPPIMHPFIEMQLAQVAIWDEKNDAAILHLDRAGEMLGQSFIQTFRDNLSTASNHVMLAALYLDADAVDVARERVDEILRVFPANAHAKLVIAKAHVAEGNEESARQALIEALEIWSGADAEYLLGQESQTLLESL
jgi:tetratricopeptide (TPR) repeat protein